MAKKVDVGKMMEDRFTSIDANLSTLQLGSEEHSRAMKDYTLLAHELNERHKIDVQAEDNEAKRDEQKRVNDKELEFKETQLAIEVQKMTNEKEFKKKQNEINAMGVGANVVEWMLSWFGYGMLTTRVAKAEYAATDGASFIPPNNLQRALNDFRPKKRF